MHTPHTQLPPGLVERVAQLLNTNTADVMKHFSIHRPISIRINTLKINRHEFIQRCAAQNIDLEPVNWWQNAFIVRNLTSRELTESNLYKEGLFYIQNLSSMIPALVLDPEKDDAVLDMAAAPGSKTTQLGGIMENSGEIIANDLSRNRIFKLQSNLRSMGITNAKTKNLPAERLWQQYPEYFNRVLLDAPCSMEGTINVALPHTYAHWSPRTIKRLAHRQQWMLRSAISATKPGGIIVYSTCTLSVEENEAVIDWLLNKEKDTVIVEPINIPHLKISPPVMKWKNKAFDSGVSLTVRIMPDELMEGFYIAKLRKTKSNVRL